jgi:hypothetical protein
MHRAAGWPAGRLPSANPNPSPHPRPPPHPLTPSPLPPKVDDKAVQTPFADGRAVTLTFPAASAPERVVFVLKETSPEAWINNGSQFTAQLKPPDLSALVGRVLAVEGSADHWSLLNRFNMAVELLEAFDTAGGRAGGGGGGGGAVGRCVE